MTDHRGPDAALLINPQLDVDAIRRTYAAEGRVLIRDFLEERSAQALHRFLNQEMPWDWWYATLRPVNNGVGSLRCLPENFDHIHALTLEVQRRFDEGVFAYSFYRTVNDHGSGCLCLECDFRKLLAQPTTLALLSAMTGTALAHPGEVFSSCYLPNSFLATHRDNDNGQIGFVCNLTQGWRPDFGGNLHFLTEDYQTIREVITPQFNTLLLFELPAARGTPHFVSHVAAGVTRKRLAISGWIK